jgi:predicted transcriptional regulator of viral defense system
MNYEALVAKTQNLPFFGKDVLAGSWENPKSQELQLHRWVKAGRLIRLKRGIYTLPDDRRKIHFSSAWLANTLYSPSYLSFEFSLSWYDLIPERVSTVTSVTLLKTAKFENTLGCFSYRNLQNDFFFGFETVEDEFKREVLMAKPEKALLDFLYLSRNWEPTEEFFREGLRLQQLDQLNFSQLKKYAQVLSIKKIIQSLTILMKMAEK